MSKAALKSAYNIDGYLLAQHWAVMLHICYKEPPRGGWFSLSVNSVAVKFRCDRKTARSYLQYLRDHNLIELQVRVGRTKSNRLKINHDLLSKISTIPVSEFDQIGENCPVLHENEEYCPILEVKRGEIPHEKGRDSPKNGAKIPNVQSKSKDFKEAHGAGSDGWTSVAFSLMRGFKPVYPGTSIRVPSLGPYPEPLQNALYDEGWSNPKTDAA